MNLWELFSTRRIRRHRFFYSFPYRIGALTLIALVSGFGARAPDRLTGASVEQVDAHHHNLFLVSANHRHGFVHAVTTAISVVAAITAAVVTGVVLNLTQTGFQVQVGADQQVR